MASIKYLDFELMILKSGDVYMARIVEAPGGQANVTFSLPFDKLELEEFLMRMRQPRRSPAEVDAARKFGGKLFETIFDAEMRSCLRSSLDEADRQKAGLRIRLRFGDEAADLGDLPWEYLYYAGLDRFFVLSTELPLVRYLEMPERIEPLTAAPPLKVLVMISAPSDQVQLDVEKEWATVKQALADLETRKLVVVERLDEATMPALQRKLRQGEYNILHFVGHGEFDRDSGDGGLLLENEDGTSRFVSGKDLGTLLHDHRPMRVAVLNACEGGRAAKDNQFAGAAQALMQQGIPGVIAMQFKVSDDAAIALSREFYGALSDGYPVDAALTEGRKAVYALGDNVEWGTPVMYLRAPDGRIFDMGKEADSMSDDRKKEGEKPAGQSFNISVGGNVNGKMNVAGGDINETNIAGDNVTGDKISVGSISGSTGVAIGRGSSATVNQGADAAELAKVFADMFSQLDALKAKGVPETDIADAKETVEAVKEEAAKGDKADEGVITKHLRNIARMGPDILDVVTASLTNPVAGVAVVVKKIAAKARADAGLS